VECDIFLDACTQRRHDVRYTTQTAPDLHASMDRPGSRQSIAAYQGIIALRGSGGAWWGSALMPIDTSRPTRERFLTRVERSWSQHRMAAIGVLLTSAYLASVAVDARRNAHIGTGDTNNLVQGGRVLINCIKEGEWSGCGYYTGTNQTAVFPYPLLQYLPSVGFSLFGWSDDSVLIGLKWLNFFALLGILALVGLAFRNRTRLIWIAWPVLIGSSLMYQANSAFGEALAALAVVSATVAAALRRPIWCTAAVCVACLGKETLAPFVVLLCLTVARGHGARVLPHRRMMMAILGGASVGFGVSAAFNVVRFGTPRNLLYLDETLRTPGIGRKVEWFLALLISPSGGLLWFWPGFVVVMCLSVFFSARTQSWMQRLISAVPALVVLASLSGLALWFSPFGWLAFGPRLAVPLLPATLFTVLWTQGDELLRVCGQRRVAASIVGLAVSVAAIPTYSAPWRWSLVVRALITPSTTDCPAMTELTIQEQPDRYYECVSHVMWRARPQILDEAVAFAPSIAGAAWLLGFGGGLCLFLAGFRQVTDVQLGDSGTST
jgi:hypothetical protein